jgi:integration host factor subunit beta
MTKSELVDSLTLRFGRLEHKKVEACVGVILELMTKTLVDNDRIEIRGFGSFSIHTRKGGTSRNPKTGESIQIPERKMPHFKPGKELRQRVNATL